ncbi:hypothetical protein [Pseudomonas nitroreducens]|uniref:cupredoxin domain-containing protein n=1 Tax=Pseudomonas nitroreducens TaxID=46680 RepID=UPI002F35BFCC
MTSGESVRSVLKNEGLVLHELNLCKPAAHLEHQKEMVEMFRSGYLAAMKVSGVEHDMAGMNHNDASSVLIESGEVRELVWTFRKVSGLQFACNIPGHYQKGMLGRIEINQ